MKQLTFFEFSATHKHFKDLVSAENEEKGDILVDVCQDYFDYLVSYKKINDTVMTSKYGYEFIAFVDFIMSVSCKKYDICDAFRIREKHFDASIELFILSNAHVTK